MPKVSFEISENPIVNSKNSVLYSKKYKFIELIVNETKTIFSISFDENIPGSNELLDILDKILTDKMFKYNLSESSTCNDEKDISTIESFFEFLNEYQPILLYNWLQKYEVQPFIKKAYENTTIML